MSTTVETEIRPFHVDIPEEQIDNLRRRIAATRWPSKELVEDRSQGVQLATLQELAHYWTTQYHFGRVEARLNAAAAVRHRDRRCGHPLHPRPFAARGCVAADHDPRLARLRHGDDRLRRPADGPDRARRQRRGCLSPPCALPARVRLLGRAGRGRLGPGPDRTAWAELMRGLGYSRYVAKVARLERQVKAANQASRCFQNRGKDP
jgi:hypothetical protein